jgi:hypothetical protein
VRRLTMRRLALRSRTVRRLALRSRTVRGLALRRVPLMRRLALVSRLPLVRGLAPSAALGRGLLCPAALLGRLATLRAVHILRTRSTRSTRSTRFHVLLPAWLAPRLPRTPWSLRRRRHICSF